MRDKIRSLVLVVLAAATLACSAAQGAPEPPAAPAIDEARVTEIATAAFDAFNAGDYPGWSRDWSTAMRSAIDAEAFAAWRAGVMDELGPFVSLGRPTIGSRSEGTYRWSFPVAFERGTVSIGFGFADGREDVEGVFVE